MSNPSLWSDEQSGHSWLPAPEPTTAEYAKPSSPTEDHPQRQAAGSRLGFPTLLIVACGVGGVTAALVEMLR